METDNFTYSFYPYLNPEARLIREEVFVKEQGFKEEFDEVDEFAMHMVLYKDGVPVGTGRLYPGDNDEEFILGRIAVLPDYRGLHLGTKILSLLEEEAQQQGAVSVALSAQRRIQGNYEKQGYTATGDTYFEEFCEHVRMVKEL